MEREKITLTGAPETMLATLYGRALDSKGPVSVLNDHAAAEAVERIDYDFSKTRMTDSKAKGVAGRAKKLDVWTNEFLAANPTSTVLHLGCGLDTRVQRLSPPDTVRWFDVDYPDVISLRSRVLPAPEGDYHLISSSVTDAEWLSAVPDDRPTVAVFEGLTMYLTPHEGKAMIRRITSRFPSGQLIFDVFGTAGIKLQKFVPLVQNAGATLHWGIDNPAEIEALHPGLKCMDSLRRIDMVNRAKLPWRPRVILSTISHIPKLRDIAQIMRFQY